MEQRKRARTKTPIVIGCLLLQIAGGGFFLSNSWPFSLRETRQPVFEGVQKTLGLPLKVKDETPPASSLTLSDSTIISALKKILQKENVSVDQLNIQTIDGIVRLEGTVSNILAKEKAVRTAETLKGVRAVVDQIRVKPSRSFLDQDIRKDIDAALKVDPVTRTESVQVKVNNGKVVLNGEMPNWQTKYLVEQAVKGVKGVTAVENKLRIDQKPLQDDQVIQTAIEQRLKSDAWISEDEIKVKVEDRQVTLSGTVHSAAEKSRVNSYAWSAGVRSVTDDALQVKWKDNHSLRRDPAKMNPSDNAIKESIKDAFLFDPRVLSTNPEITVENGVVTLSGTARNLAAKEAAEEDARNTPGVVQVKNNIRVSSLDLPGDREVENLIRQAILRDPYVEKFNIRVKVEEGKAILKGEVHTPSEKWQVRRITASIPGVVNIDDFLEVKYPRPELTDQALVKEIKERLWWNPNVDSYQIVVDGENHDVTLTGTTDTWVERALAEDIAYESGARQVNNLIQLRQASDFNPQS